MESRRPGAPRAVPNYALYGEQPRAPQDEPLHCESIAARSRLHQWEIDVHRHDAFFQILYIERGRARAVVDGAELALAGPCVLRLPPLAVHGFRFSPGVHGWVITVVDAHLEAVCREAPGLWAELARPVLLPLAGDDDAAREVRAVLQAFAREHARDAPWRVASLRALLLRALLLLARLDTLPRPQAPLRGADRKWNHLRRFKALVDAHYRERRPVAAWAQPLGITATQLNRLCRELTGRSVLETVDARLLLEACRDLRYTSLSAKEIALTLGFSDAAYFSRWFVKQTGRTPTAYRAETD